jgi:hypothetical protein
MLFTSVHIEMNILSEVAGPSRATVIVHSNQVDVPQGADVINVSLNFIFYFSLKILLLLSEPRNEI